MRSLALIIALLAAVVVMVTSHPRCPPGGMMKMIPKILGFLKGKKSEFMMDGEDPMLEWIKSDTKSCLNFEYPENFYTIPRECMLMHAPTLLIRAALKKKAPEKKDCQKFMASIAMCIWDEHGLLTDTMTIDLSKIRNQMKELKLTGDATDIALVKGYWSTCIDEATPQEPKDIQESLMMMGSVLRCFSKKMMDRCKKDIGVMHPINYVMTFGKEEDKCSDVKVNPEVETAMMDCIKEKAPLIKKRMKKEKGAMFGEMVSTYMSKRDNINMKDMLKKVGMKFKEEMKRNCAEMTRCFATKLGFLNGNQLDTGKYMDYFSEFSGWDQTILTSFKDKVEKCYTTFEIERSADGMIDVSSDDQLKELMQMSIKCKLPALAETCGTENKMIEFFFPMANKKVAELMFNEFKPSMKINPRSGAITMADDCSSEEGATCDDMSDGM